METLLDRLGGWILGGNLDWGLGGWQWQGAAASPVVADSDINATELGFHGCRGQWPGRS
jgi:hypothetical protein